MSISAVNRFDGKCFCMKENINLDSALYKIIQNSSYYLSLREITSILKKQYDIKVSYETVRSHLKKLSLENVSKVKLHQKITRNKYPELVNTIKSLCMDHKNYPVIILILF